MAVEARRLCRTPPMTSREDLHRLVDALPAARLPAVERLLRASLADTDPTERRCFASTGTLSAEHDLAERSEDVLRSDGDPDSVGGRDASSA
ncbi:hypothetical protein DQ238_19005 [Geodermatophilus sp. TF02-6]|nr:hypothetical protein DQ238_19005 [Geodermatophilus sp. TF02-6]